MGKIRSPQKATINAVRPDIFWISDYDCDHAIETPAVLFPFSPALPYTGIFQEIY